MKVKKSYGVWAILLILSIVAISTYRHMYQGHRNIATEQAALILSGPEIHSHLREGTDQAKYVDQVIQIWGTITAIEQHAIIIEDKVQVDFVGDLPSNLSVAGTITIKGRCVGYDDLLELVKIDQAILMPNK